MSRKRISVPAAEIKRRCICRQCGRDVYDADIARENRENDTPAADIDANGKLELVDVLKILKEITK